MAADWIKIRTDLYRDPKISLIADRLLRVMRDAKRDVTSDVTRSMVRCAVVGALVSVWGVFRHRGKRDGDDLRCSGVSIPIIDDIADLFGFGDAMAAVGWVRADADGIIFPGFFKEYNVSPEQSGALRQRRYREKNRSASVTGDVTGNVTRDAPGDVTRDVTVTHRDRDRDRDREEREEETPTPFPESEAFRQAWRDWESHRKELRKPLRPIGRKQQLADLANWGVEAAIESIRLSIRNGYSGLFDPRERQKPPARAAPAADAEARMQKARDDAMQIIKNGGII